MRDAVRGFWSVLGWSDQCEEALLPWGKFSCGLQVTCVVFRSLVWFSGLSCGHQVCYDNHLIKFEKCLLLTLGEIII